MPMLKVFQKSLPALAGTFLVNGCMLFLFVSLHLYLPAPSPARKDSQVTIFHLKEKKKPPKPKIYSPRKKTLPPKSKAPKRRNKPASPSARTFAPRLLPIPLPMPGIRLENVPYAAVEDAWIPTLPSTEENVPEASGSGDDDAPRNPNEVDQNPEPVYSPEPIYPHTLKRRWKEGRVRLKFVVDREGRVQDIEIVKFIGDQRFCKSAKNAVMKWRFRPARKSNRPVSCYCYQWISFNVEGR